jgi:dTDP-4-amino-4,6-dideoxygalactose transaminase
MALIARRPEDDRPVREELLVFGRPVVDAPAIAEVIDTLRSGWLGRGPKTEEFEARFARQVRVPHACAVNSGSAALLLALKVAGIGAGDEVITTPLTFAATLHAIVNVGATPVLVDVDRTTQNICPDRAASAVSARTKALLPVHLAGRPCEMDELCSLASEYGLLVIDDAAHAIGAEYHGHPIGSVSDLTAFSFQASKIITTGEGGMVTTARTEWAEELAVLSRHGMSADAWGQFGESSRSVPVAIAPGFKMSMGDLQAAIGLHQLVEIDRSRERRERIWSAYDDALAELPLQLPAPEAPATVHARHLYSVALDLERLATGRDSIRDALRREGIGTGVHYVPAHLHPYYRDVLPYGPGSFPNAEWIGERTLSLPMSPFLDDQDVDDVSTAMWKVTVPR